MGNCLVLEENVGIVIKTEGKVEKVLPLFSHSTPNEFPVVKLVHPNHFHSLVPEAEFPRPMKKTKMKMKTSVQFPGKGVLGVGVVRIKVVISKKELQEMLIKGEVSVDGMILKVQNKETTDKAEYTKGRLPARLETIPEID